MIVYITINLINGKKYIGKDEVNNPDYLGSGRNIKHAIKKYGRENFIKEILCYGKDRNDLRELEKYYVDYYNAQYSDLFYNIAPGGDGGKLCIDYSYREKPVVEVNVETFDIIKEYKSSKIAAIENSLNYKGLNAVCNNKKHNIKNRIFRFKEDYNKRELVASYLPKRQKYITLSYKTGIYYYTLDELRITEYPQFKTLSSFLNYTFRHKDFFINEFITTRI